MSTATAPVPVVRSPAPHRAVIARPAIVARWVWRLSGLNLVLTVAVLLLIFVVSERWWLAAAISYLPRLPWAAPSLVLGVLAALVHRRSLGPNAVALALVLGPIMELRLPGVLNAPSHALPVTHQETLRVASCNVQAYKPNFADVLREVTAARPDVVLFQEAFGDHALLHDAFPGWHKLHVVTYWVASRYPLKLVAEIPSEAFDRVSGVLVEVDAPAGPILVANIHQMTARPGFTSLTPGMVLRGEAADQVDGFRDLREFESAEIRTVIDEHRGNRPLIVAGDFNTPSSSHVYQQVWGDLQNAFDIAGLGFGYTSPCKPHRYWFTNVPWARIDHILCSPEWTVERCEIGRSCGSDHHSVTAVLKR